MPFGYCALRWLMRHSASDVTAAQFPDTLAIDGMVLPLSYHFEPGSEDDGVTVTVPLPALNLLKPQRFEWLVPGLLHEKVCQLLKSLPKSLRRNFVPVPNFADACLQAIAASDEPLPESISEALQKHLLRMSGIKITHADWDLSKLTPHMRMNFKVVDDKGNCVAMGRDLLQLQGKLKEQAQQSFAAVPVWDGERRGITAWDFGDLPEHVEFVRNGVQMRGYPALVDHTESVAIQLFDTPQQAEHETRIALRRLVNFAAADKINYLGKSLPHFKQMALYYATHGRAEDLQQDLIDTIIDQAFFGDGPLPRTKAQFETCLTNGRQNLLNVANQLCALVRDTLEQHHQLNKRLKAKLPPAWLPAIADINEQLKHLIYSRFINQTPFEWLKEYPRYLKAVNLRLEKLGGAKARDRANMLEIKPLWQAYLDRKQKHEKQGIKGAELETYRWMIEELRVSLFAQELKTKMPVSSKRVKQRMAQLPPPP